MIKFGRNYRAVFTIGHRNPDNFDEMIDEEVITIEYPFSVNFSIDTGMYSTSNSGQFTFYNLNSNDRAKLWLDLFETGKKYVRMEFYAGYKNAMPKIFEGYFLECTSEKPEGSTDWLTHIQAFNAGDFFKYGFINATFTQGTTLEDILRLATEGTDIKLGYITPDIPPLPMNKTFIGKTMDLITREWGGYNIWIDNGEINILGENEVIPGEVDVITDESGLLGSPRRANLFIELDMLFSPYYRAGQAVSLLSYSMPQFNRAYQISKVHHQGIISPSVAGKLTTKLTMSMFSSNIEKNLKMVEHAKATGYAAPAVKNIEWQKPVKSGKITSPYNPNRIIEGKSFPHYGVDIGVPVGTPVFAAANGKIVFSGWQADKDHKKGFGKYIRIDHGLDEEGNTVLSYYGHLSQIIKTHGQVSKGEIIGKSGNTGHSTGPHLHFEIRKTKGLKVQRINPVSMINF